MKKLIMSMLLIAVMLAGCTTSLEPSLQVAPQVIPAEETYSGVTYNDTTTVVDQRLWNVYGIVGVTCAEGIYDVLDGFGVYGSPVKFNGVYPGWKATGVLTIINGQDRERTLAISVHKAIEVETGYEALPELYFWWFTITEPVVTIQAGGVYQLPIILEMPSYSDYTDKRAVVRIRVIDTTQLTLETNWYITTIKEAR